jgi:hypothetical protein
MKTTTADYKETCWQIHLQLELVLPATSACLALSVHYVTTLTQHQHDSLLYRKISERDRKIQLDLKIIYSFEYNFLV